jgi:hypothetical protein
MKNILQLPNRGARGGAMLILNGTWGVAMGVAGVLLAGLPAAHAIRPDECEQQRALYPKVWADVSAEKSLFDCASHYAGSLRIKLGATDRAGRAIMSLVPLKRSGETAVEDPSAGVFRIWLDKEQIARLKAGKYFATILRKESACWIRGSLEGAAIFLLDEADPRPDTRDAGSFYNQAPRMSAFEGDAYECKPTK